MTSSSSRVTGILLIFHVFLGVFNPPVDGTYLLTVYAITVGTDGGPMYIKKNDAVLCSAWVVEANAYTATCSAVTQLAVGDSVRVTGSSSNPATIQAPYCGFVGHIISDNLTA